jgi:molybdenum cofactor cytidylyltransferase
VIAAVLLAAGSARRFGAPKLVQDLGGKPLIRWSAEVLTGPPVDEIVVVVPPDHGGLTAALAGIPARFVVNAQPDSGIGASVACGIQALGEGTRAALVALADEPSLSHPVLQGVVGQYRETGASIVVPRFRGTRGHPVLFDRSVFDELRALTGDQGARTVTERNPGRVAILEVDEDKPADVDTTADLSRLRSAPQYMSPTLPKLP